VTARAVARRAFEDSARVTILTSDRTMLAVQVESEFRVVNLRQLPTRSRVTRGAVRSE
jgi:hypothetical protein